MGPRVYQATTELEVDVPPEVLLEAVWRVESYPEFVRGVKQVELLSDDEATRRARFVASIAGLEFRYELEIRRTPREVTWRRVAGSFRDSRGAMRHLGGRRFRYENALDPGFAVPEFAVKMVLDRSLPRLLKEFEGRARALHARTAG